MGNNLKNATFSKQLSVIKERKIHILNACLIVLPDMSACIACETSFEHAVKHVEFDAEDFCLSLIFFAEAEGVPEPKSLKFEYPIDHDFLALLKEKEVVTIAQIKGEVLLNMSSVPVSFVNQH